MMAPYCMPVKGCCNTHSFATRQLNCEHRPAMVVVCNETVAALWMGLACFGLCPRAQRPCFPWAQHRRGHVSRPRHACEHPAWRPLVTSRNAENPGLGTKSDSSATKCLAREE